MHQQRSLSTLTCDELDYGELSGDNKNVMKHRKLRGGDKLFPILKMDPKTKVEDACYRMTTFLDSDDIMRIRLFNYRSYFLAM